MTVGTYREVDARKQRAYPAFSTCEKCRRSFRAKSEDQLSVQLCDECFDALRHPREPLLCVHVKARAR